MEFFGLYYYGVSDPIKDMLRPDYKEPTQPPKEVHLIGDSKKSFSERVKELDCYIGFADGYSYGSRDRLIRTRRKCIFKPIGPQDMYLYPGITSMDYGWWNGDPSLECGKGTENWYQPRKRYPMVTTEISRYII